MPDPVDPAWRPEFGGLRHEFRFDPLHYGVGGERQQTFKERMREELKQYGFILIGEVGVTWRLLVDEQERWETGAGADVDNFAKLLNDGLLGPDSILVDDVQIQSMQIYWMAAVAGPSFELTIDCRPDEWASRPVSLYELADGLWYPLPDNIREHVASMARLLHYRDDQALLTKRLRHHLRQRGLSQRDAFYAAMLVSMGARGFHSTRAATSGLSSIRRSDWRIELTRPANLPPLAEEQVSELADAIMISREGPGRP